MKFSILITSYLKLFTYKNELEFILTFQVPKRQFKRQKIRELDDDFSLSGFLKRQVTLSFFKAVKGF